MLRLEYYFFINGQKNGLSKSETFPEQGNALNNVECDLKVFINQESLAYWHAISDDFYCLKYNIWNFEM